MSYDIQALQMHFQGIMPYLNTNLGQKNAEYMDSQIPHGAFNYVLERHTNATILANISVMPREKLADDQTLFQVGAVVLMDLENVLDNVSGVEKADATQKCEALLAFYEASGFTEKHGFYSYPVLPKVTKELQPESA